MSTQEKTAITIETTINAPAERVWEFWNNPGHITKWCSASDDWHAPHAENDLRKDGRFKTTMAAKDGSVSFDFSGVYTAVEPNKRLAYTLDDDRKVQVSFEENGNRTRVVETFEAEDENPVDMQRDGWQAILDNFRKYCELRQEAG